MPTVKPTRKPPAARMVRRKPAAAAPSLALVTGALSVAKPLAAYEAKHGLARYVAGIRGATPLQLVEAERAGVKARLVKDLAGELGLAAVRFYEVLGVPKATVEAKVANDEVIAGAGGQRALAMVRLLAQAGDIVSRSTASQAAAFDTAKWLGEWIETPQPALGGRRPADLLDTPTGFEIVARTLGSLESGAYL